MENPVSWNEVEKVIYKAFRDELECERAETVGMLQGSMVPLEHRIFDYLAVRSFFVPFALTPCWDKGIHTNNPIEQAIRDAIDEQRSSSKPRHSAVRAVYLKLKKRKHLRYEEVNDGESRIVEQG